MHVFGVSNTKHILSLALLFPVTHWWFQFIPNISAADSFLPGWKNTQDQQRATWADCIPNFSGCLQLVDPSCIGFVEILGRRIQRQFQAQNLCWQIGGTRIKVQQVDLMPFGITQYCVYCLLYGSANIAVEVGYFTTILGYLNEAWEKKGPMFTAVPSFRLRKCEAIETSCPLGGRGTGGRGIHFRDELYDFSFLNQHDNIDMI